MDIEGAEQGVLRTGTDWARHVRSIKVEVHEPYRVPECLRDLERLGFSARLDSAYRIGYGKPPIIGVRPELAR